MASRSRLWILTLGAVLALAVGLFGEGVAVWLKGGENGIINLPGMACMAPPSSGVPVPGGASGNFRWGIKKADLADGAQIYLPSTMPTAVAVVSIGGIAVTVSHVSKVFILPGPNLVALRDNDVSNFAVQFIDKDLRSISMKFRLYPNQANYTVLIK